MTSSDLQNSNDPENTLETSSAASSPFGWVTVVAAVSCVVGVTFPAIANLNLLSAPGEIGQTKFEGEGAFSAAKTESIAKHLDAFAWTTRVKLEDLSLNRSVEVNVTESGYLRITGKITRGSVAEFELFKDWYASRKNFPKLLDEVEQLEEIGLLPGLKSVWFGTKDVAYFDDGSFGSIGSQVGDGWQILNIDKQTVTFQNEQTIVSIKYR